MFLSMLSAMSTLPLLRARSTLAMVMRISSGVPLNSLMASCRTLVASCYDMGTQQTLCLLPPTTGGLTALKTSSGKLKAITCPNLARERDMETAGSSPATWKPSSGWPQPPTERIQRRKKRAHFGVQGHCSWRAGGRCPASGGYRKPQLPVPYHLKVFPWVTYDASP